MLNCKKLIKYKSLRYGYDNRSCPTKAIQYSRDSHHPAAALYYYFIIHSVGSDSPFGMNSWKRFSRSHLKSKVISILMK
ncbi:hypothetical protein EB796_013042 [Bugula neritina]|uniref:Uncharacterized protein n=1 Tax=Bugula neritina TaxID=10212 RepID=A0A7J7JQN1_BUGNE|nr:hypothetical protein EB796_013042 [Bugula neritina]